MGQGPKAMHSKCLLLSNTLLQVVDLCNTCMRKQQYVDIMTVVLASHLLSPATNDKQMQRPTSFPSVCIDTCVTGTFRPQTNKGEQKIVRQGNWWTKAIINIRWKAVSGL